MTERSCNYCGRGASYITLPYAWFKACDNCGKASLMGAFSAPSQMAEPEIEERNAALAHYQLESLSEQRELFPLGEGGAA